MRVFVYEYLCSPARACEGWPDSLRAEGRAMLAAVHEDLARCPGVLPITLPEPLTAGEEETAFRKLVRTADFSLVIAPEFDDLLYQRCRWVEEENGRLLGPTSAAVRLTGDKLALASHLHSRGVPTPPTAPLSPTVPDQPFPFPVVCKPRHGAGSQATFLVRDARELAGCARLAEAEGYRGELVVQPYAAGRSVSVALLLGPGRQIALPAVEQVLSEDGRFRYRGGRLPLPPSLEKRAQDLARRAVAAVEGLHGYVGVDLVLGEDRVIEINPRVTTSYVGLRALARFNLMAALLAVVTGGPLPAWEWGEGPITFSADGA